MKPKQTAIEASEKADDRIASTHMRNFMRKNGV
jgi:hypothetical protein